MHSLLYSRLRLGLLVEWQADIAYIHASHEDDGLAVRANTLLTRLQLVQEHIHFVRTLFMRQRNQLCVVISNGPQSSSSIGLAGRALDLPLHALATVRRWTTLGSWDLHYRITPSIPDMLPPDDSRWDGTPPNIDRTLQGMLNVESRWDGVAHLARLRQYPSLPRLQVLHVTHDYDRFDADWSAQEALLNDIEDNNIVGHALRSLKLKNCWAMVCGDSLQLVHFVFTNDDLLRPTVQDILAFLRRNKAAPLHSLVLSYAMSDNPGSLTDDVVVVQSLANVKVEDYTGPVVDFLRRVDFPNAEARIRVLLEDDSDMSTRNVRALAPSLQDTMDAFVCLFGISLFSERSLTPAVPNFAPTLAPASTIVKSCANAGFEWAVDAQGVPESGDGNIRADADGVQSWCARIERRKSYRPHQDETGRRLSLVARQREIMLLEVDGSEHVLSGDTVSEEVLVVHLGQRARYPAEHTAGIDSVCLIAQGMDVTTYKFVFEHKPVFMGFAHRPAEIDGIILFDDRRRSEALSVHWLVASCGGLEANATS
ncbi:hypothetical protein PENSPDRAFT_671011 [Peniophora sp. CONT]|nr:hypothetical protein PENSPDRAFT_671011 [Peniophora sp. CONT]